MICPYCAKMAYDCEMQHISHFLYDKELSNPLLKPYIHIGDDLLYTALKSEFRAVQAQVVIAGVRPLQTRIIFVVICLSLVGLLDKFL